MMEYGYTWEWVYPLRQEAAERLFRENFVVMQLFPDETEKGVESLEELREHAKNGGIFGVEKEPWEIMVFDGIQAEITEKEPSREDQLVNGKEDTFGIYQLVPSEENSNIMFASLHELRLQLKQIDRKNYQLVYTAPLDPKMTLDGIFQKFNTDLPKDYRGRSLSVSDVVVFQRDGKLSAHYVDSIGFKDVSNFLTLENEKMLTPDPSISETDMYEYGYKWYGMHPLRQETAKTLFAEGVEIYRLYSYNQDERVRDLDQLLSHANRGGIFGVQKAVWDSYRQNIAMLNNGSNKDVEYSKIPEAPKKTPQDKLKEITDKLEDGIAELCDSEHYKSYLKTMSKFHSYSVNNSMLIWMQKPEATMVAGYNAWKSKFGRQVMKGEHGITIISPCPSQKTEELPKLDPKTMQPMYDEDGQPIMQNVKSTSMYFKATTVFDVSQTEGKPLPEAPIQDLSGDVTNYTTMLQALIQAAPCPVSFGDPGDGAKGSFSRATQSITIKEGMSQQETLATLVHEIGHSILHADREEALKLPRGTREVQAESVAYTVCSHYGIDTSAWTFGYVATWSRGQEMSTLKSTLDTIRSTSAQIINKTDEQLAQLLAPKQSPQISQAPTLTM